MQELRTSASSAVPPAAVPGFSLVSMMRRGKPRWASAAVAVAVFSIAALAAPVDVPDSELRALGQTSANGRDYVLQVGFPLSYETAGAERRYPVVYVLDGYWDFPLVASAADFVRRDGHAPEAIVVGIGYAGSAPDVGLLRQWDLTPGLDDEYDPNGEKTGHAAEFLGVLEREIIPFVERTYRADPSFRVMVGSSFGGLFAIYTAFQRPGLFQGFVTSSPAVWWNHEYALGLAQAHAARSAGLDARMYLGWASGDSDRLVEPALRFAQDVARLNISGLRLAAREIEGGGHSGSKPENFTRGLRFVFAPQSWVEPVGADPGYGSMGKFVNLSTRGMVQSGDRVLIGGIVVHGILPKRVLVRAAGPALAQIGVSGVLANPRFRIVDAEGRTVAENDDWGRGPSPDAVAEATTKAGAFAFATDSLDAALIVTLDPGPYTVVVSGPAGAEGVALVEAYELGR